MKNLSILLLFALATFGFWVFSSAEILAPFSSSGTGYRSYFGVFSFPELLKLALFSLWVIFISRLGAIFFTGGAASYFRFAAAAFVFFLFLDSEGIFIPSNYVSEFFLRVLIYAALLSIAAWFGLRTRPDKTRNA